MTERRFRNVVGPQIRKARNEKGWSQLTFEARLQVAGLGLSRSSVAKIELQIRSVFDYELQIIAEVLEVSPEALFPPISRTKKDLKQLTRDDR